jgi:hypothetical protein
MASPSPSTNPILRSDLSPLEASILADDVVSDSEMERVFLALLDCFEHAGLPVTDAEFRPGSGWSYDVRVLDQRSLVAIEDCERDLLGPVADVYSASIQPTPEERADLLDELHDCLSALGFANVPLQPPSAMREAVGTEAYVECLLQMDRRS